jgi:predicted metal-dependent phosphoesterase TrpH
MTGDAGGVGAGDVPAAGGEGADSADDAENGDSADGAGGADAADGAGGADDADGAGGADDADEAGAVTRVDLHVKVVDERVVERAKAAGLDVLVYAPHFEHLSTIAERAARFSDEELLVVPAREYFTGKWSSRKHVLAVDPDYPVPDFLTLEDTMAELADQDAAVLAPHPEFLTLSLDREDIATYAEWIDAVEVYNPKHWSRDNRRAREIARESGLPTYLSSYAHLCSTVGEAWVELEAEVDSAADLVTALREGVPRRMFHRNGLAHTLKCRAEFAHLGWENSWDKFERVVLTDEEATHPAGEGYDDRFAELNAYR